MIDTNVTVVEREIAAGDFRLDLLAKTEDGRPAVIENQFGRSDHDHLGKLVTYLAEFDAEVAIWIVEQPRAGHVTAVSWLNSSCADAAFYLIKAESITIGNSEPALLLTKIVGPGEESKVIANKKKQLTEQNHLTHDFWTGLLKRIQGKTTLHENQSPSVKDFLSTDTGVYNIGLNYRIFENRWGVDLCKHTNKDSKDESERIFDALTDRKTEIEENFREDLKWGRQARGQLCKISFFEEGQGFGSSIDSWDKLQDKMIDTMIRFEAAIRQPLQETMQHESTTTPSVHN